jgi:hypothetical protein
MLDHGTHRHEGVQSPRSTFTVRRHSEQSVRIVPHYRNRPAVVLLDEFDGVALCGLLACQDYLSARPVRKIHVPMVIETKENIVRHVVIVGTGHSYHIPPTGSAADEFRAFLGKICNARQVQAIAEEMSEDILPEWGVSSTLMS